MKSLNYIFCLISLMLISGCEDDVNDFDHPHYVSLQELETPVVVEQDGSATFDVTAYSSITTGSNREIRLEVVESSTTVNASVYNVPSTLTIPGGANSGSASIVLEDDNLDNDGGVLVVQLVEENGVYTGAPIRINVSKLCPYDLSEIPGMYANNSGFYEDQLSGFEIVSGSSENEFIVKDFFSLGTDVTFTVNSDNTISVEKQDAWVSGQYGQASVESASGTVLEPCANGRLTFVLTHTVSAGSFGNITEVLTKE